MKGNLALSLPICPVGLAAVLFLATVSDARTQLSDERASDRAQITSMLSRWEAAWNTHDMAAFASLFHEDAVWVSWTGSVWSGRHAIETGHADVHKTIFRNSIQRERLEELTFVGLDAAIVRFCSALTGDERAPDSVIRSRKVLLVTKRDGSWGIGWGQNTRLADTAPDSECFESLRKTPGPPAQSGGPEAVVDAFVRAWNSHDAQAFGDIFSEDAFWITASGVRIKGRAGIQSFLGEEHLTWARTTTIKPADVDVKSVGAGLAVVSFMWDIATAAAGDGKAVGPFRGSTLLVAANQANRWTVVAGQVASAPSAR